MRKSKSHLYDKSYKFFIKYSEAINRRVVIRLKDGRMMSGFLTGFYKGDPELNESYIVKWQLAENDVAPAGNELFGFKSGRLIEQADIAEVRFPSDNTVIKFS